MTTTRRVPLLVLIAALLAGGGVLDRQKSRPVPAAAARLEPKAASARALASTWYCTGGSSTGTGSADATVLVANAGSRPLRGAVVIVPNVGEPREVAVDVPAAGQVQIRTQSVVNAPFVSVFVELDGGQAVAELAVTGPLGFSVTPCASSASRRWYFAEGSTTKDATEIVSVFNPFPEDAIVDFAFGTEEGRVSPEALSGLVVPGRGMLSVNVGEHVHRRQVVAATVSARVGRVVAGRLQTFDGTAGRKGLSLALGAPEAGRTWYFPEGLVADGLTERYQIFNPFRSEAVVDVEFALEKGEAEPLQLRVPPQSRLTVTANEENRIPKGVAHAAVVRVTGGEGVIAERTVDSAAPAAHAGVAWTLGAGRPSKVWAFAAGGADETVDETISVLNPGATEAVVSLGVLGDGQLAGVDGLQEVHIGAGQRLAWRLGDHLKRSSAPVELRSTVPVVVERGLYPTKTAGTAMTMGIPLQ